MLSPWPWYVAGPMIGLVVPLLLLTVGKPFGISSSFRHLCSLALPGSRLHYLNQHDWRRETWNLLFVGGIAIGAALGAQFHSAEPVLLLPDHYSGLSGIVRLFLGGLLVGFGTRYADGCTSGHSIMGISSLNWPSLVATLSFFAGGLLVIHVVPGLWVVGSAP
ncbi:MAG: YeeE/YedE thiosulfate transporter family protein [Candidatus Latescibacterota bacterium]|nr:YeeE/YedE thiosulfate transporter family protein [Candidatus Latescibacterota bacterium]